jgi:hypothetical protein
MYVNCLKTTIVQAIKRTDIVNWLTTVTNLNADREVFICFADRKLSAGLFEDKNKAG